MSGAEQIVVGISGGVDSAVAALRLLRAGFEVHGLHMTNWDEADEYCSAAEDYQAARAVCRELGIPLHRANFAAAYREQVFASFLDEYRAGRTPNPDVLCNRYIKFGVFLEYAMRLGASRIATGHYARLAPGPRLLTAADKEKDQTYFLHAVHREALERVMFPIGDLAKSEVRRLANEAGLPNHERPDSTGICFIGERPFRDFLRRYLDGAEGDIKTPAGEIVGRHQGLMFYTLGQRTGLGIGGSRGGSGEAWYVVAKDLDLNVLVVAQGRGHPWLWSEGVTTAEPRWISGTPAGILQDTGMRCQVRVRHRHAPAGALVSSRGSTGLAIRFEQPQWAVAPGQFAVIYDGETCLGGAVIEAAVRAS